MSGPNIVTFYSYKGGTGRSMALANVAWILAANRNRVLVIDWDLEAPGLHRYFHPFLNDKELTGSDGLIDFVIHYAEQAVSAGRKPKNWYKPYANILRYAKSLDYPFAEKGTIDFVPAGRQGADYATRVNAFNWQHFYEQLDGGLLLEAAKLSMADYDYVLIDSRTGVSDTSGICTVQMPHTLVVCFTLNTQSIDGAAAVAESADAQRRNAKGERTLRILPVPTRVEPTERTKLEAGLAAARKRFDPLLWHTSGSLEDYWNQASVQYQPYYAFEEVLAVFADAPGNAQSMLSSMEALAGQIASTKGFLRLPPLLVADRNAILARYLRQKVVESPYVMHTLTGHLGQVKCLAVSLVDGLLFSGDETGIVKRWDQESGVPKGSLQVHTGSVRAISIVDGNVFTAGDDGTVRLGTGFETDFDPVIRMRAAINALAVSDQGNVVAGSQDGQVSYASFKNFISTSIGRHGGPVQAAVVTPDGKFAVTGSYDRILIQWDLSNSRPVRTFSGHTAEVNTAAISTDGKLLLSGSYDNTLKLWDLETGTMLRTFEGHSDAVRAVAMRTDLALAASGSADKTVKIWDLETGSLLLTLTSHSESVNAIAFMPGGYRVVSGSDDGTLIVWNIEEAVTQHPLKDVSVDSENVDVQAIQPSTRVVHESNSPLVYLSYSHLDHDRYFDKFVTDLEAEIRQQWGLGGTPVIWRDKTLSLDESWVSERAIALGSARVAICMVSPSYVGSAFCGREFSVLNFRSKSRTGILPIIWRPVDHLPSAIAAIQAVDRDFPTMYLNEGLVYIIRLSRHRLEYRRIVDHLVKRIVDMARRSPLVVVEKIPDLEDTTNAFAEKEFGADEAGTKGVFFVVPNESPFGKPLFAIAQEITMQSRFRFAERITSFDSSFVEKTAASGGILVFIVHPEELESLEFSTKLAGRSRCALLVLNIAGKVRLPPRPPRGIGYYSGNIQTETEFRDAIRNALVRIQQALISKTSAGDDIDEAPTLPSHP